MCHMTRQRPRSVSSLPVRTRWPDSRPVGSRCPHTGRCPARSGKVRFPVHSGHCCRLSPPICTCMCFHTFTNSDTAHLHPWSMVILGLLLVYADWQKGGVCLRVRVCVCFMTLNYWDMFVVRLKDSLNFPQGWIKYIVIVAYLMAHLVTAHKDSGVVLLFCWCKTYTHSCGFVLFLHDSLTWPCSLPNPVFSDLKVVAK